MDGVDYRGKAEIIIAKHRNGAVGDVVLTFKKEFTRFQNPEDDVFEGKVTSGASLGQEESVDLPRDFMPFAPGNENIAF